MNHMIKEAGLHKEIFDHLRTTARAIILNDNKEVLMMYSKHFDDYTFPGGGLKTGEDVLEALKREVKEETGLEIVIKHKILEVDELRYGINGSDNIYLQTSHYYLCDIIGLGQRDLNEREQNQGLEVTFVHPLRALNHNKRVHPDEKHQKKRLKNCFVKKKIMF